MPRLCGAAAAALTALCALASPALAHEGNPNYRSEVRAVPRSADGLRAEILGYDDRIELSNDTGELVVVSGYRDEPYLRFLPDGTVEVNRRSPASYLNEDRFAAVEVPASARPDAEPVWEQVAENGRYGWHDHRVHWMAKEPPEQVRRDESRRVKVFDWRVPVAVGERRGAIEGTLTWVGKQDGGLPVAALVSLAAALVGGAGLVAVVRRRRRRDTGAATEAW